MNVPHSTIEDRQVTTLIWTTQQNVTVGDINNDRGGKKRFDLLQPLRRILDNMDVRDPELAHRLCEMIPAQCPFERDVKLFGRSLFHIPPLCKLNPLYEEVSNLRFRALCYLADECGEDVSHYC
ncbi:Mo-dependent nitrogenase C-terminal domain-containing protein [Aerosakkonemataceae cyanobacterium BLCC-F50]|uniref:Mo-dependent nitrogenase C-terminal domain-containing protein n=1 Tax=Floridaenema flaviceps BLCC-F50 TaxID=3153642 RepID=A0ABV4XWJ1_9CYAN